MSRPTATAAPRFGAWTLGKVAREDSECLDCRCVIPKGTSAWRTVTGGAWGRRCCAGCMVKRQAARGRIAPTLPPVTPKPPKKARAYERQAPHGIAEPCSGPSCDRPARSKGLCDSHYKQMQAHGQVYRLARYQRSVIGRAA